MAITINGTPWFQQNAFNDSSATDISTFSAGSALPAYFSNGQMVMTKNRVYLLSSYSSNTCYTATIDSYGIISSWSTVSTTLPKIFLAEAIVTSSRVYILGGRRGGTEAQPWLATWSTTINYADINSDGTLGTFYEDTVTLPITPYEKPVFFVLRGKLYYIRYNSTYVATIDEDGILGSFSDTGLSDIPGYDVYQIARANVSITSTRVYLIGGMTSGSAHARIRYAEYDNDGVLGEWSSGTNLPSTRYGAGCITIKNYVFLLGGVTGTTATDAVIGAPIDSSGVIGTWSSKTSLPAYTNFYDANLFITNSRIYLVGKYDLTSTNYSSFSGGLNDYTLKVYADPPGECFFYTPPITMDAQGTFPAIGYVEFDTPAPWVSGIGNNPILGYGEFNAPLPRFTAAEMSFGYTEMDTPSVSLSATGSVPIYGDVEFDTKRVVLDASGTSQVFGFGNINTKLVALFAESGGDVRMNSKAVSLASTGVMAYPGFGNINAPRVSLSSYGTQTLTATVNMTPLLPKLISRSTGSSGYEVIKYRR